MRQIWLGTRSGLALGLAVVVPLALAVLAAVLLRDRIPERWRGPLRRAGEVAAVVAAVALVAGVTLAPSGYALRSVNAVPFRDVILAIREGDDPTRSLLNCAANAALFVPLGAALALARQSFGRSSMVVAAVSLAVEALQYLTPVGRVADVTDLMTNVAGAVLGWYAFAAIRRVLRPPGPVADGATVSVTPGR